MGTLKPGATYIYERTGSEIYARESGSTERKLIGYTYDGEGVHETSQIMRDLHNYQLWNEVRAAARTNPTLLKAVERAILIYKLSKDYVGKD